MASSGTTRRCSRCISFRSSLRTLRIPVNNKCPGRCRSASGRNSDDARSSATSQKRPIIKWPALGLSSLQTWFIVCFGPYPVVLRCLKNHPYRPPAKSYLYILALGLSLCPPIKAIKKISISGDVAKLLADNSPGWMMFTNVLLERTCVKTYVCRSFLAIVATSLLPTESARSRKSRPVTRCSVRRLQLCALRMNVRRRRGKQAGASSYANFAKRYMTHAMVSFERYSPL